ncbi:transcriptional regulator [Actinoplanes philippinensis]|uniref:Anionic cell wall polymer biosynthesis enzyme, LytR-Cps2A-Psr (LCP) family n=1 Tax=Actinoplanes philippinensis TaxID=35752 RepID=A0A1I2MJ42_9ACTN|nr:LCP family protein [Actinoplanes philippinensis]GIE82842.1 transcriptional regulator [Actinoplanes philippinensis]SFF91535.1 Anionic cell wall polymer biosynthesis enzyme, LytR-Cps2A-Psr (LCP) family [Actinoplanes philippinensis]
MPKSTKRRTPLWARLCAAFGAVLLIASGGTLVTGQTLIAKYTSGITDEGLLDGDAAQAATKKDEIKGPLTILLVGIDPRKPETPPLSDSILIAHIPADMSTAYLFSMPRDLYVDIAADSKSGVRAHRGKINSAMALGSQVNGKIDVTNGFKVLSKTIRNYTGIEQFDAAAIINFGGFKDMVEALGGVSMVIDMDVKSEHLTPEGKQRPRKASCPVTSSCDHPYTGPQAYYKKSTKPVRLQPWQALDYVRQRYPNVEGVDMSDYDRQRHQQQFIKAMAKEAMSKGVITDVGKITKIMDAAGKSLTFAGGGNSPIEWALALKDVNVDDMVTIKLDGGGIFENPANNTGYLGEKFSNPDQATAFFNAVKQDQVAQFLLDNPGIVNMDS